MSQSTIDKTPSDKQLKYLRNLKYTGPAPATSGEASKLIEELLGKKPNSPAPQASPRIEEPSVVYEEATDEDLKYSEPLLNSAAKFHRLAVTAIKKRGEPLRGDIINAERNFLVKIAKLRACEDHS